MQRRSSPVSPSSLPPEPLNLSRFMWEHHQNQTLEDVFARLSVSASSPFINPSPFDHLYGGVFGFHPHQSSNLGQSPETILRFNNHGRNSLAGNGETLPQNPWVCGDHRDGSASGSSGSWPGSYSTFGTGGYSSSSDGFLDSEPLSRQREFRTGFRSVSLSNGGGDESLRQGTPNGRRVHLANDLLRGKILSMGKDQNGSRVLQDVMKKLGTEEFSFVFSELIGHVTELMLDPFGNYVVQKMVEMSSEEQRYRIILMVTEHNFQLVRICLSQHGARAVEKLLEHITTQEQRSIIMSAISPGAIPLSKDINGHRVVLYCLKHFAAEDIKQLLIEVANNAFGIARDKTGCCVLQQCVNHAEGEIRKKLIADIVLNASVLAEDCYGNYVVQHLLSLKIPIVTGSLLQQLQGKFSYLSCNKYGSNVVEKFFQDSGEVHSTRIILELLRDPNVARLLVDPYGNYVIKSALVVSKGAIRNALLELIQINSQMMRSNLYGKKLLDRFDRGKIRHA